MAGQEQETDGIDMKFFWNRGRDDHEERHSAFSASSFSASSMALLMVAPAPPAVADQAKVTVSATVLKHASLKVLEQPSAVVVTPEDIARGYVEVPLPARVRVKNNSAGYLLNFASSAEFASRIRVRGLGPDVLMSGDGGLIAQSASSRGMATVTLDLGFRFELAAGAHEGVYPWPLELSVTPL